MADTAADATKGPSKKELNKLARKNKTPSAPKEDNAKFSILFTKSASPELTRAVDLYLGDAGLVKYLINKGADSHLPLLKSVAETDSWTISGDENIARYLVRTSAEPAAQALYGNGDALATSQIDQWLAVFDRAACSTSVRDSLVSLINTHVADKTYLVGSVLTLADLAIWTALKKISFVPAFDAVPHASRWFELVAASVTWSAIPVSFVAPVAAAAKKSGEADSSASKGGAKSAAAATSAVVSEEAEAGALGSCPPLEGAVEGQVVTRFPPEPSGYLHIGHAKAVLLNQYYAQHYKGRLLVRFDDTNPSKEKDEFQENIIKDLATLNVVADSVSHSSDHFKKCEELARMMIREGNAYMDDTDQETMQAERMAHTESKHRNASVEANLKWFEDLLLGTVEAQKYCLRAKIDMASLNGTMRDPVLYRFNETPHLRTGTKFKAYPTYDFACPIIDSIEGVTHALRTTEYNDRDEQYHWIQNALHLRYVYIHSFGKMNFIHTVLSKRKLTWFVEQGLVESWFDPRFPTIQGCVRRGMNVEALKSFIIGQGASRRVITMEWDKFWSENKKVLEDKSPRYMGVADTDKVELVLTNVADEVTAHSVQIHPQKPEQGNRVMRRYNKVYLDQEDAATYKVDEQVTLLRWGNVTITHIETAPDGKVLFMKGVYDAESTNFSKTKKATWIANVPDLVPCTLVEFDHLISKAKLTEDDKFQDYVNPVTRTESAALCDPCLRTVQAGEVIQLERKGFFRCDTPYGGSPDKPALLFLIPDGKGKKVAKK